MDGAQMNLWMRALPFASAALLFLLLMCLQASYHPERMIWKACEELSGFLKVRGRETAWYQKNRAWLEKNGASFHYGEWMNPVCLLAIRIVGAAVGFGVFAPISTGFGILAAALLFILPGILLGYLNKRDNERMLPEMKLVYNALEIQIKAGVYVTDALAECYGSIQDKRLRQAFLDLAGDIVMKADIYEALERFQKKFDNRYVDSLCITVLQALESGQALELLSDIGEQIKDMEALVMERKKASLDRSMTFYQLCVLAAVLGVALYACVTDMFAAASGF
nr:type II secretion system F family protein [uncultured Acetatifactor sp.]